MQAKKLFEKNGNIDLLEINWLDVAIVGVETTIGVMVPYVGTPKTIVADAGTTLDVWSSVTVGMGLGDTMIEAIVQMCPHNRLVK